MSTNKLVEVEHEDVVESVIRNAPDHPIGSNLCTAPHVISESVSDINVSIAEHIHTRSFTERPVDERQDESPSSNLIRC